MKKGMTRKEVKSLHLNHPAQELVYICPMVGLLEAQGGCQLVTVDNSCIVVPKETREEVLENIHLRTVYTYLLVKRKCMWH